jgi:hypothetical protein
MANFHVVVRLYQVPWPFSFGPFRRNRALRLGADEAALTIHQAGELSCPIEVGCHSGDDECTVTVDFRGGTRLKRRTKLVGGTK